MLKLILTILFISIPAFAVDAIYAWGYGEDIKNILISIKFLTGNATYLIKTAIALGLLLVLYRDTQENNTDRIVKVAFLALIVSQLFFHAKKDYMVEDEVTNQAFAVTDIPIGIGELFSLFTMTERVLIKAFESSYSTPNSLNYSEVGLGFSMSAHLATNDAMFKDENSHKTFMEYTTNCIASGLLDGQISDNFIASENIVSDIRVTGFETIVYYKKFGEPQKVEQMSCHDAYDKHIKNHFYYESNDYIKNRIGTQMRLQLEKVTTGMEDTSKLFFGVSKSGAEYVMQQMGKNMLKKGLEVMAITTGGDTQALAYATAKSSSTMENQWQQAGMMAQTTLPMIKAYLTSVILAMTPLLALLSIMFGDWKYIKMIITLLTTLMLFSPLASIINYLMYLRLEVIIPVFSNGLWMPMLAMRDINSQIFNYLSFLGYAAMSIPLLAYALVKASEQGFVNFMSGMGGSVSGAANVGAGEKTSGVNLGNTKVGSGSHTGKNGTTTDIGNGSTKTEISGSDNGGAYSGHSLKTANGNIIDDLKNDVASWTANNGKISSVTMNNLGASLAKTETDSFQQAKATESSTLKSLSNTLSSGLSTSMAQGQIYTSSDDFSKNTGINNADSRAIVDSQNEAIVSTLNKKLSEAQTSNTTSDAGFKLGGHVGWDAKDTFVGEITGVSAGANGNFTISGTSTDGKSFSADVSKDDMANIQKSVSDNLSKTFTQDSGLALRTSQTLADNQVFSNTALKSNMDAYTKAHSVAEKYSENYSKTGTNSSNIDHKKMNQIVESFIDKDERLKSMYESTSIESKRQAISEGTKRIDNAVEKGVGADYNSLQTVFKEILNQDLSSNASSLVDTQLTQGKNLDSNVRNFVSQGQNNISNTNVNNSINQNPANTYQSQINNAKTNSIQNMDNYKENTSLNNQEKIDKGNEILKEHKDDNDKSSRSGKALESVISGVPDMKKGYENLADLTKWETPGSDGKQELKNSEKNWDENLNKLFNKEISPQVTQGKNLDTTLQNGVNQGQNNISNTNVNNSINQNPANTYQSQIDNAKTDFSDDIKGIPQSLVFKSQHNPQIAEVKEQLSYLKDDIENLNMSNIQSIIDNKKGKK